MDSLPAPILTDRTILRMPELADVSAILAFYRENRAHLAPYEPSRSPSFETAAYWEDRVAAIQRDYADDRAIGRFLFDRCQGDRVIGTINLNGIVRGVGQYGTLGYSLDGRLQGSGLMVEALTVALPAAFAAHGLHRIQANYMPSNERSGKLLRRLGFVVEGYARDYLMIAGSWRDHVLTSLTDPTWQA